MKRVILFIVTVAMLFSVSVIEISAAEEPVLTVSNAIASEGETVKVNVIVSGNPGMNATVLKPVYDKTVLELMSIQYNTDLFPGNIEYGKKAVWSSSRDTNVNGTFLTITFKVCERAQTGKTKVSVENKDGYLIDGSVSNRAEKTIRYRVIDGSVNVIERSALTLSVPTVCAEKGSYITMDIRLSNNPGISAAALNPVYDKSILELVSMRYNTELFPGNTEYGKRAIWVSSQDISTNDIFLSVTFKILDDAKLGKSNVSIEYKDGDICNKTEKSFICNILDGAVNVSDSSNGIIIFSEAGVIEDGAKLNISNNISIDIPEIAGFDISTSAIYDISFEKDGKKIQPNGKVTVSIPVPKALDGGKCSVLYFDDNGKITDMHAVYTNGSMVFTTDHFSYYIVAEKNAVMYDLNGDGKFNSKDVVRLMKIIAITPGVSVVQSTDINGDGSTNSKDIVRLMKILASAE